MQARIKKTIKKYEMLRPGETVVLGVSGGADSLGLLHILHELSEYGLDLIVAHLNHGIRGKEAKRDAQFVERIAASLNLKFESETVDTHAHREKSRLSLEDAARELRYKFFHQVAEKYNADKIATAHTLDDQAETVLMRLLRGSGSTGLSGIPPVSTGLIIRPLIETNRSDIEAYLESKGVEWIEDSTNKLRTLLRNRIRLDLIPELESYNPQIKETLARTSDILRLEDDYMRKEGEKHLTRVFTRNKSELAGDLKKYKRLHAALRLTVLRIALEELKRSLKNISFVHLVSADEFLMSETPSGEAEFPEKIVIAKGYDNFLVTTKSELERKFSYSIPSTGKWSFEEFEVDIEEVKTDTLEEESEHVAYFDPDSVEFPLEARSIKPGDGFIPLGMKNSKKVKDLFIDLKVPRFLRRRVPIFTSKGEIMWIGGIRMDERFKVRKKGGRQALRFSLKTPRLYP